MTPGRPNKAGAAALLLALLLLAAPASAQPIAHPVAAFAGLDKITGRLTDFDVYMDETVQFGSLQLTPRACTARPAAEARGDSVFVEIDQVSLSGTIARIFSGWMLADSPALSAIDDPIYDVWLVDCKTSSDIPPP